MEKLKTCWAAQNLWISTEFKSEPQLGRVWRVLKLQIFLVFYCGVCQQEEETHRSQRQFYSAVWSADTVHWYSVPGANADRTGHQCWCNEQWPRTTWLPSTSTAWPSAKECIRCEWCLSSSCRSLLAWEQCAGGRRCVFGHVVVTYQFRVVTA